MEPTDVHSYSNPSEIAVTHLSWQASVDFAKRILYCTARWTLMHIRSTDSLILDTKDLLIKSVLADGKKADFVPGKRDPILGSALMIKILPGTQSIEIEYETTPGAEALQWLEPGQTAGKRMPFLFSQSQAILARSWIPCQDTPGVRFTYEARVKVPDGMLALMSASNPTEASVDAAYSFVMNQPVPSYLMALCVGDLTFRPVSERCGIYSEPTLLDAACYEFADLEQMVLTAESLYGPYLWERYDLIVLPPSFPFGGMENPRLTFVTPTIIAGDRSLTSLIAHELAHSWSGNLVTNATWNDFWLNEGFTVYFETRIMEQLYGKDYGEMLALLNLEDLKREVDELTSKGKAADTKLRLDLKGRSPDEGVTEIAYNKGYFFLRTLEENYGRRRFDQFVRDYFSNHAFQSVDTDQFKTYLIGYYKSSFGVKLDTAMIDRWIGQEGLPSECFVPQTHLFDQVKSVIQKWIQLGVLPGEPVDWNTQQWLFFLGQLPPVLDRPQLEALDGFGRFSQRSNSEIFTPWALHCIRSEYSPIYSRLREFLMITGRRKFILPLYEELMKSEKGRTFAREVYAQARPNYHFVATNSLDPVLNGSK